MIKNGRAPVVCLLLAACGGGQEEPRRYQGVVELEEQDLAFEVAGRVERIPVEEGEAVKPGTLVARLDDQLARTAFAARQAEAEVAEEQWKLLRAGARGEDLRALQARLDAARAGEVFARSQAERTRRLAQAQAVTEVAMEEADAQLRRAQGETRALEENLRALTRGARSQELEAALHRLSAAQAAVELERERWARYELRAVQPGEVLEVHLEPSENASPGLPVVTVADVTRPFAEIFVPQAEISGVRVGNPARARVDGLGEEVPGRVELIYRRTEFTPRYLFSERERGDLVVRVKVRLDDRQRRLRAGIPTFVRLDGAGQGRQ